MEKERKQQILKAALKRFIKHGINKTTLDEIARDLRIGKATLYHYFKSKEDLYYQTLAFDINQYLAELRSIFSNPEQDTREKLREYFNLKDNFQARYKLIYELFIRIITETEILDEKKLFQQVLESERRYFMEVLGDANKDRQEESARLLTSQGWKILIENKLSETSGNNSSDRETIINVLLSAGS